MIGLGKLAIKANEAHQVGKEGKLGKIGKLGKFTGLLNLMLSVMFFFILHSKTARVKQDRIMFGHNKTAGVNINKTVSCLDTTRQPESI